MACQGAMGIGKATILNLATLLMDDVALSHFNTLWFSIYLPVCFLL